MVFGQRDRMGYPPPEFFILIPPPKIYSRFRPQIAAGGFGMVDSPFILLTSKVNRIAFTLLSFTRISSFPFISFQSLLNSFFFKTNIVPNCHFYKLLRFNDLFLINWFLR